MNVVTFILVVCWYIAGIWLLIGEIPRWHQYRIERILGVSNRFGKIIIGLALIAFCSRMVWLWYVDPNSPPALLWEPLKLSY